MKHPNWKEISLTLACLFLLFTGWEMHVFKLWVADVLNRANICDETNCQEMLKLSQELNNYNLPVKGKK